MIEYVPDFVWDYIRVASIFFILKWAVIFAIGFTVKKFIEWAFSPNTFVDITRGLVAFSITLVVCGFVCNDTAHAKTNPFLRSMCGS